MVGTVDEIVKLWREKCMYLFPSVEQHQMVPFHKHWVQTQFIEEKKIMAMQEKDPAYGSIRHGCKQKRLLAQQLHRKAGVPEGL